MEFGLILRQLINPVAPFPLPPALAPSLGLDGHSWGYGYNLAAHYKPCELFALGISYRSQVKQSASLSADIDTAGDRPVAHTDAATSVTLPASIAFGLALYPTKYLSWEVGGVWTQWSKFNAITFDFAQPILGFPSVTSPKDWHDTWRFQTGVEYKVLPCLDLRAGYIYDEEAINSNFADYLLPSNNRHLFSFGPGFHWDKWSLDLSYTYILVEDRDVTHSLSAGYANPTFLRDGNANIIALSLGYRF